MKKEIHMKNNTFFKLFVIIVIAFLFRIYMLDKPEGLWNDEYMGWFIASKNSVAEFTKELMRNCHMPFYYIYLKIWINLFGDTDYILRLSSVVPSLISILIMYFAGKEVKDNNLGLFSAFITAISSFSIYFAQEMRLYSLLFLISSIQLLYFIKLIKEPSKKNFILFSFSNVMLFFTHTLGVAFCGINFLVIMYFFYKHNEKYHELFKNFINLMKQISPILICLLLLSPLIVNIVLTPSLSQFWADFNFSKIIFVFTDYFSPIQLSILSPPNSFFKLVYANNEINFDFIILAIIPTLIAIYSIINAIKQNKKTLNYALLSSLIFFFILILIAISGRMILLTKYSTEIYPSLIIALALGLISIKKNYLKNALIFLFIGINIFYLCYAKDSAHKKTRHEGHKAPIELIKKSKLKENDQVILTFYDKSRFEKYIDINSNYDFSSIHKSNFQEIMFDITKHDEYIKLITDGKELYRDYFKIFPNPKIVEYVQTKYVSKMKKGDRIALVYMKNISMYTNYNVQNIVKNDKKYEKNNFIFLAFSHLINNILYVFDKELEMESMTKAGGWFLVVYVKTK